MNDVSMKEEDREIDIEKYTTEEAYKAAKADEEVPEEDEDENKIKVDIDKVYNDE